MRKMDEMDRDIQLRSEELGYRTVLLALCAWTVFNISESLAKGTELKMLPCLILCLAVCVQWFSQTAMKRNMTAGDEEYTEPDKLVRAVISAAVVLTVILAAGVYFLRKA